MFKSNTNHVAIVTDRITDALTHIQQTDPAYFKRYEGECFLVCDSSSLWESKVGTPNPIESTLLDPITLGFHLLAQVKLGANTVEKILTWFEKSLAYVQTPIDADLVTSTLDHLRKIYMIEESQNQYKVTTLGRVSTDMYISPEDVYWWYRTGKIITTEAPTGWETDIVFSYIYAGIPSIQLNYVQKEHAETTQQYTYVLNSKFPMLRPSTLQIPANVYDWLQERSQAFTIRSFIQDTERMLSALQRVAQTSGWPIGYDTAFWTNQQLRLTYGVSTNLVPLCRLPNIGRARAMQLFAKGVKTPNDVIDAKNRSIVLQTLGNNVGQRLIVETKELLKI